MGRLSASTYTINHKSDLLNVSPQCLHIASKQCFLDNDISFFDNMYLAFSQDPFCTISSRDENS